MKISTRGQYSLEALLCIATNPSDKPNSIHWISQKTSISEGYLEQLFIPLKKAGIVSGSRGASGGYQLSKPLKEINAYDILVATETSLSAVPCLQKEHCHFAETCKTKPVWEKVDSTFAEILKSITLEDLVNVFRGVVGEYYG